MSSYHVLCRISGGVTGTQEALLKTHGTVIVFDSREAAQAEVNRLAYKEKWENRYATAHVTYAVVEGE